MPVLISQVVGKDILSEETVIPLSAGKSDLATDLSLATASRSARSDDLMSLISEHCGGRSLEFMIRQCQIGDEIALSLLGKATFLETYAGIAEATDILAHVETEHSVESYRTCLESDLATIWVAETSVGHSAIGYAVALASENNGLCAEMEFKRLDLRYAFHRTS